MAFKNIVIFAAVMPMMISAAMPMPYHSAGLSIRTTEYASDAASPSAGSSGSKTKSDDAADAMPKAVSKNVEQDQNAHAPDSPTVAPWEDKTSLDGDASPQNATNTTQKPVVNDTPTVPPSSSNGTSPSREHQKPIRHTNAAAYLESTKLQLIAYCPPSASSLS
ncbi:hypothetical protein H4Q26_004331 [Puccinia striiformis f. sp. tritici PST-130]|nr:hypothetical protein H4Q26_004331 [Puccinia striiformis f. sp. tritici PST-130]